MTLTPADVHNVAFSKPPIGKRGYNEDEVDAFLDLVEAELAKLVEENNDLRQRVTELDEQVAAGPAAKQPVAQRSASEPTPVPAPVQVQKTQEPTPVPTPAPAAASAPATTDHNAQATKVLALAQEMADRLTGEAKSEADALTSSSKASADKRLGDARTRSETMVTEARTKADQLTSDARTKSDAMLTDARTKSETLQRQAKEKAEALQADAERKHTELMGSINTQRGSLEKKIEELRTFEREYRTRLKTYLESQLQELGQRGSAAPAEGARAAAPTPQPGQSPSGLGARTEQGS